MQSALYFLLFISLGVAQWSEEQTGYHTDVCSLPSDYGDCSDHYRMFYYNRPRGRCMSFDYSTCGGNENRFPSKQDCNDYCGPDRKSVKKKSRG